MTYRFAPQPLPTLSRYRAMRRRTPGATILRALQYEHLEQVSARTTDGITGRVLDFGGGRGTTYMPLLPPGLDIASVNIDAEFEPTHVLAPGAPLPFAPASFDSAICLNVLEHIFDARAALDQIAGALRPGGRMFMSVPFIYRVHGHPDDYSRHTSSWWRRSLEEAGFSEIVITPLVWGRATTAQLIGGKGLFKAFNVWKAAMTDIVLAQILFPGTTHYEGRRARLVDTIPPGWFVEAVR